MKNNMIQAWKNADNLANFEAPVASVSVSENIMMNDITGGKSSGLICGVSADAWGFNCNPFSGFPTIF
jgi:hypothetical protein